jgi:large subunit ribosomal protein L28
MAKVCEITGKRTVTGNNVSHSQRKTKRKFLPNLHSIAFNSEKLNRKFKLKVTANGIRTIEHNGGLDNYLLNTPNSRLSAEAKKIKKLLLGKTA